MTTGNLTSKVDDLNRRVFELQDQINRNKITSDGETSLLREVYMRPLESQVAGLAEGLQESARAVDKLSDKTFHEIEQIKIKLNTVDTVLKAVLAATGVNVALLLWLIAGGN